MHRANVECLEGMINGCAVRLKERFGLASVVDYYKQHIAERKRLVHNEMYRLFVSSDPMVMCKDVVGEIEKFIGWWSVCARGLRGRR